MEASCIGRAKIRREWVADGLSTGGWALPKCPIGSCSPTSSRSRLYLVAICFLLRAAWSTGPACQLPALAGRNFAGCLYRAMAACAVRETLRPRNEPGRMYVPRGGATASGQRAATSSSIHGSLRRTVRPPDPVFVSSSLDPSDFESSTGRWSCCHPTLSRNDCDQVIDRSSCATPAVCVCSHPGP